MGQRPQDTEEPTSVDCPPGKVLDSEQGQPGRAMELQWCTLGDGLPSLWHSGNATAHLSRGTVGDGLPSLWHLGNATAHLSRGTVGADICPADSCLALVSVLFALCPFWIGGLYFAVYLGYAKLSFWPYRGSQARACLESQETLY